MSDGTKMAASDHIYEAEDLLRRWPDAAMSSFEQARCMIAAAEAHALVARALQEEERLDGCTRHHGQARP